LEKEAVRNKKIFKKNANGCGVVFHVSYELLSRLQKKEARKFKSEN